MYKFARGRVQKRFSCRAATHRCEMITALTLQWAQIMIGLRSGDRDPIGRSCSHDSYIREVKRSLLMADTTTSAHQAHFGHNPLQW